MTGFIKCVTRCESTASFILPSAFFPPLSVPLHQLVGHSDNLLKVCISSPWWDDDDEAIARRINIVTHGRVHRLGFGFEVGWHRGVTHMIAGTLIPFGHVFTFWSFCYRNLSHTGLLGDIPSALGKLTTLVTLDMGNNKVCNTCGPWNQVRGDLAALGNLVNLQSL